MSKIIIIIILSLLSACAMVGPDFKEPPALIANHWQDNHSPAKELPIADTNWWKNFHDPILTALINHSYQNNLSLQIAGVHVLQERAHLAQFVGELYPQQQAIAGNYTYQRIGGNMLSGLLPSNFDTALLGFSTSWELDFWGKYRRAIQSQDASFAASLAAYDNALITLIADTASTYTSIRTYEEQIRVTQRNIKEQTVSLAIANARFKAGETSLLDVQQAQTELSQTQASLPMLVANVQHYKDTLAVLLGTTPEQVNHLIIGGHKIPAAPATVAVGIPKQALCRRPDVHQALLEALAQSAAIGAVKANLYPAFSLSGTFAFAANTIGSSSISDMFNWQNRNISAGPSVTWPVLNYGQITNAVRMQDAVFQQALLNYQNLVLKAQQEVQDNITNYVEARKSERYLTTANTAAVTSVKLALVRYKEGQANYTTVVDAERQQLQVQLELTNAIGSVAQSLVALYRSLGGGWQIRNGNDIVANEIKAAMAARTNWGNLLVQPNHQAPTSKGQHLKQLYLPNW